MSDVTEHVCERCRSDSLAPEHIVEHDCGHVAPSDAFADRCVKCGHETEDDTLRSVGTAAHCLACGHRTVTDLESAAPAGDGPEPVTFPTLPSPDDHWAWMPARFLPESGAMRQFMTSILVVLVLISGVAGALSVSPLLESEPEPVSVEQSWEEYDSVVIFRNDDIQPWYLPDELRAVNQVFIDEDVPVTLGVIPMVEGEAPLTDDEQTCAYLRSLEADHPGQFEMALHGYTHEPVTDFYGASEFGDLSADEQRERLAAGEEILADCVDSPSSTFIPPMNTYDETTVEVLADANYTTVSGGEWFTADYFDEPGRFDEGGLVHVPENTAMENWSAYADEDAAADSGNNETADATDVPLQDLESLTNQFDESHAENGVQVVMLHYQYFTTEEDLELLESLIQHMKGEDTAFLTLEQFALGLEQGTLEETDDGWRVLEPLSDAGDETASTDAAAERSNGNFRDLIATAQRGLHR
ncbi:DUF2334 domain-containing protein [Natronolimnobius baerhuensis]|uniref:DUF2334 domain-containing protein n=1 Tax=Natronolimnobius baerhuensis TaxID=253108 RepID=A0A202E782_9EURY|nr:DUF2334 domain-containing protein [Natronolimnobius baerhuensis]OVE83998.1 DUF2334 domain-containing protein [Natronolimnobius baerhuensis]